MEVQVKELKTIYGVESSIIKFMEAGCDECMKSGEVYFSRVGKGIDRGWKIHAVATSNVAVPFGKVRFAVADFNFESCRFETLGGDVMSKLIIPPNHWYRFVGDAEPYSLIANFLDIAHQAEAGSLKQKRLSSLQPTNQVLWDKQRIINQ